MSIGCIIIVYKKNINFLLKKIINIYADVDNFYIINNSEKKIKNLIDKKITIINLDVNLGIAAAQNLALNLSFKNKNDYILFSDQDTTFPVDFIKKILNFYFFCKKKYGNLFAVAPNLYDRNKNVLSGFVQRNFLFRSNIFQNESNSKNNNDSKITEAMSSGMFINVKKLKKIGFLNENFFLDWVDFDLCWRALKKGYNIIGSRNIVASHFLGSKSIKIFGKSFHIHPPFRSYYIVRNGINLSLYSKNINFFWRINIFLNTLRYSIGYLVFTRPFLKVLKFVILGFAHGFLNILGKINYD
jgi:rhamnosyltransferase